MDARSESDGDGADGGSGQGSDSNHRERIRAAAIALARLGWAVVPCYGVLRPYDYELGPSLEAVCSCSKRGDCVTPGKHPQGKGWEALASNDPVAVAKWDCWLGETQPKPNLGVRWGEASGVIDVEYDSDIGRETIESLGLAECETPTYRSARSVHRVFLWQPGLPETAVFKVNGLEIRIGNKPCQSIVPPSEHASGVDYEWLDDRSPWDVSPMALPESLVQMIAGGSGDAGQGVGRTAPAARAVYGGAGTGERHDSLLRLATRKFFDLRDLNDRTAVDLVLEDLRLVNQTRCSPPKPDADVVNCWRSAYQYAVRARAEAPVDAADIPRHVAAAEAASGRWKSRAEEAASEAAAAASRAAAIASEAASIQDPSLRRAAERKAATAARAAAKATERAEKLAGRAEKASAKAAEASTGAMEPVDPLEPAGPGYGVVGLHGVGLESRDGEWWPGSWSLEIVRADPPIYRVSLPWEGRTIRIELGPDAIVRPSTIAAAIRTATANLLVDEVPGVWPAAWLGVPAKKKRPAKVGILAKLIRTAKFVDPILGVDNRIGVVAAAFLAELTVGLVPPDFPAEDSDDVADRPSGARCYARSGGRVWLYFRWPDVWRAATERDKSLTAAESRKLRKILSESGGTIDSQLVRNGPVVSRLACLDRAAFEALVRLAQE